MMVLHQSGRAGKKNENSSGLDRVFHTLVMEAHIAGLSGLQDKVVEERVFCIRAQCRRIDSS